MPSFVQIVAKGTAFPVKLQAVDAVAARARSREAPEHPYQGVVDFQGIPVHLENRRGSVRKGDGWRTKMMHHYGEIRGTTGADGDPVDCYVGPNHDSPTVVVVRQKVPGSKRYDEDKVMLGFDGVRQALTEYRRHYDKPGFYGGHTVTSVPAFKRWLDGRGGNKQRTKFAAVVADMHKAAMPAGGGWEPIMHGKHGGYRKREGDHYVYFYPSAKHSFRAGKHHFGQARALRKKLDRIGRGKKRVSPEEHKRLLDQYEHHASQAESAFLHNVHTRGQAAGKEARKEEVRATMRAKMRAAHAAGVESGKTGESKTGEMKVEAPADKPAVAAKQERLTEEQLGEVKAGKLGTKSEIAAVIKKLEGAKTPHPIAQAKLDEAVKHLKEAHGHAPEKKPEPGKPATAGEPMPTSPEELAKHPAVATMIEQAAKKAVAEHKAKEKAKAEAKTKAKAASKAAAAERSAQVKEKVEKLGKPKPAEVSKRWLAHYPETPEHPAWQKLHAKAEAGKLTATQLVRAGMERVLTSKPKAKSAKSDKGKEAKAEKAAKTAEKPATPAEKKAVEKAIIRFVRQQLGGEIRLPDNVGDWLFKAKGHKYVKRVPFTDKHGRRRYRYFYKIQHGRGVAHEEHFEVGAAFQHGDGHYHVTAVRGDRVMVRHDESGKTREISKQKLSELLRTEHAEAYEAHRQKLIRDLRQAMKTGTPKQRQRIRDEAKRLGLKIETQLKREAKKAAEVIPKHEEVGEHVFGSRADLAMIKSRKDEVLEEAGGKPVKRDTIFGQFNLLEHLTTGGTIGGYHLKEWTRTMLAAKTPKGVDNETYLEAMTLAQRTLDSAKTIEDVKTAIEELSDWGAVEVVPGETPPAGYVLDSAVQYWSGRTVKKYVSPEKEKKRKAFGSRFERLKAFGTWQASDGQKKALRTAQKVEALAEAFGSKPEKLAVAYAESIAKPRKFKESDIRAAGGFYRKGGRDPGKIEGEAIAKRFGGITNIQYGDYMRQRDRHQHLTGVAGALADMADVLRVGDRSMSVKGQLAIGLGARGGKTPQQARASAHYESDLDIVNITKHRGVGSLAHEWGHFLDAQAGKAGKGKATFATDDKPQLPERSAEAVKQLKKAIRESDYYVHAVALDGGKESVYYSDPAELFARLFESTVEDSLHAQERANTYLAVGTREQYPTMVQLDPDVSSDARVVAAHARVSELEHDVHATIAAELPRVAPKAKKDAWTYWGVSDAVLTKLTYRSPYVKKAIDDYYEARRDVVRASREARKEHEAIEAQPYPHGDERVELQAKLVAAIEAFKADGILPGSTGAIVPPVAPTEDMITRVEDPPAVSEEPLDKAAKLALAKLETEHKLSVAQRQEVEHAGRLLYETAQKDPKHLAKRFPTVASAIEHMGRVLANDWGLAPKKAASPFNQVEIDAKKARRAARTAEIKAEIEAHRNDPENIRKELEEARKELADVEGRSWYSERTKKREVNKQRKAIAEIEKRLRQATGQPEPAPEPKAKPSTKRKPRKKAEKSAPLPPMQAGAKPGVIRPYEQVVKERQEADAMLGGWITLHGHKKGAKTVAEGEDRKHAFREMGAEVEIASGRYSQGGLDAPTVELKRQYLSAREAAVKAFRAHEAATDPTAWDRAVSMSRRSAAIRLELAKRGTFVEGYSYSSATRHPDVKMAASDVERPQFKAPVETAEPAPAAKPAPAPVATVGKIPIVESRTKKRNKPIWVAATGVTPKEDRARLIAAAKEAGGWYSYADKGYAFRSSEAAEAFAREHLKGMSPSAPPESREKAPKAKRERRPVSTAATRQRREAKAISRLRDQAKSLEAAGRESHNADRLENTARRASMAAGARQQARNNIATGRTMARIADAIEDGSAGPLASISTRAHVELLDGMVRRARYQRERKDRTLDRDRRTTAEDVKGAKPPYVWLWGRDARSLEEKYAKLAPAHKRGLGNAIQTVKMLGRSDIGTEGRMHTLSNKAQRDAVIAVVDRIQKHDPKAMKHTQLKETVAEWKRWERLGIPDDQAEAALTKYLDLRVRPGEEAPERTVRSREQAVARMKIPGYFPTPPGVVSRVIDLAGIKPGDKVLEPNAGSGHLADAARDAGGAVDVVEVAHPLRELLEAKKHNLVGADHLQHEAGHYDKIVMNPPFENGADIDHVRHAFEQNLKAGGRMVAIMSEGGFFRSDKKATAFRDWLAKVGGKSEKLPPGSFKTSDRATGVNVRIVTIEKPMTKGINAMWIPIPAHVGEQLYKAQLSKGAGHKYVKRVPYTSKTGKRAYRYYYAAHHGGGVAHDAHFTVGAAFQHKGGHYHVTATSGDQVTIRHDETGETKTVSKQKLSNLLGVHHGKAIREHRQKTRRELEQARKHGSPAQIARMEAYAQKHGVGTFTDAAMKIAPAKPKPEPEKPKGEAAWQPKESKERPGFSDEPEWSRNSIRWAPGLATRPGHVHIKRGDQVFVYFGKRGGKPDFREGKAEGFSAARGEIKVRGTWHDYREVYTPEEAKQRGATVEPEPEPKPEKPEPKPEKPEKPAGKPEKPTEAEVERRRAKTRHRRAAQLTAMGRHLEAAQSTERAAEHERRALALESGGTRPVKTEKRAVPVTEVAAQVERAAWLHASRGGKVESASTFVNELFAARPHFGDSESYSSRDWTRLLTAARRGATEGAQRKERETFYAPKPKGKPAGPPGFEAAVKTAIKQHGDSLPAIRQALRQSHPEHAETTAGRMTIDRVRRSLRQQKGVFADLVKALG